MLGISRDLRKYRRQICLASSTLPQLQTAWSTSSKHHVFLFDFPYQNKMHHV